MIGITLGNLPAIALHALLAQANLVLNRGFALQVGRISGVYGNFGRGYRLCYVWSSSPLPSFLQRWRMSKVS